MTESVSSRILCAFRPNRAVDQFLFFFFNSFPIFTINFEHSSIALGNCYVAVMV